jgi:GABA permease
MPDHHSAQPFERKDLLVADTHPARDHEPLPAAAGVRVQRVLVLANQTATSPALLTELRGRAAHGDVLFHLVVPALNSRLRHWLSDTDDAVAAARRRGEEALAVLTSHGLTIEATIGDSVPLLAIEDALSRFDADAIVISTLPAEQSHWLEHDLVARARDRFPLPITHVIAAERADARTTAPTRRRRRRRTPSHMVTSS